MKQFRKELSVLLLLALLSWPVSLWVGVSTSEILWYLAWTALALGIGLAALSVALGFLPESEDSEASIMWFIPPVLTLIVPSTGLLLLLWFLDLAPHGAGELDHYATAIQVATGAVLIAGVIWALITWFAPLRRLIRRKILDR